MRTAGGKMPRKQVRRREEPREGTSLELLRQQITKLIASDALDMVAATVDQVKNGQYQALKYLFEMVGLYPAASGEEAAQEDSLAKILLSRLGIPQSSDAGGKEEKRASRDAVE
jgi:hypothetical protein